MLPGCRMQVTVIDSTEYAKVSGEMVVVTKFAYHIVRHSSIGLIIDMYRSTDGYLTVASQ
jgi:hypothetical protein